MKSHTLLTVLGLLLLVCFVPAEAGDTFYVRFDGHDTHCDGSENAAYTDPNHPSCAKKTIGAALALCDGNGDLVKVHSNTVEGVLYDEAPVVEDPNVTIEGYGGSGRPRIGKVEVLTGWSASGDTFTKSYNADYNNIVWGAYIDLKNINSPKAYEHERMTLIVHKNLADLTADPNVFGSSCTTDPNTADPTNLYLGPGFHYDPNGNLLSIRLRPTPEFTSYNSNYLDLGWSNDPNNHKILVSSSEWSLKVEDASNVTLKNLQLEAARGALTLDNADNLTVDNLVIWSGFGTAIRGNGPPSNNVLIKNSSLLHDTPYWLAWSDCKEAPAPCYEQQNDPNGTNSQGGMRSPMIEPDEDSLNWTLDHNLIRGGHDGLATKDGDANFVVSYNVFADFADDPFELEDLHVGAFDIYGNFITNSLNCLAVGQENDSNPLLRDTIIDGPIYYYSNICALARIPFVDRWRKVDEVSCCYDSCKASWSGGRRYGQHAAFKLGDEASVI